MGLPGSNFGGSAAAEDAMAQIANSMVRVACFMMVSLGFMVCHLAELF
jgi:hypothetical protein